MKMSIRCIHDIATLFKQMLKIVLKTKSKIFYSSSFKMAEKNGDYNLKNAGK